MKMEIIYSGQFRRDYKLMKKRGYDMRLLADVVEKLQSGVPLEKKYKDYELSGDFRGSRECHIRPDWLLIYWKGQEYIELQRTGRHRDLL